MKYYILLSYYISTSKVDVDPRSFEFIHDKPPLPDSLKNVEIYSALKIYSRL